MKRRLTTATLLLLLAITAHSQQSGHIGKNYDFLLYLIGNSMRDEAIELVKDIHLDNDTLYFMKGFAYYSARKLDTASLYYSLVPQGSPFYNEAQFFSALSQAHLGNYALSLSMLKTISDTAHTIQNLRNFEMAGLSLLRRDMTAFDTICRLLDSGDYHITAEAATLAELRNTIANRKQHKPWLAAGLSALVPGLGKVYAGNLGEGVSALLLTGSMMAATAENWHKEGLKNWKTILFGTLSAVFYIGNIYGSAVTVHAGLDNFNNNVNLQILYNIHIPLRNSFRH